MMRPISTTATKFKKIPSSRRLLVFLLVSILSSVTVDHDMVKIPTVTAFVFPLAVPGSKKALPSSSSMIQLLPSSSTSRSTGLVRQRQRTQSSSSSSSSSTSKTRLYGQVVRDTEDMFLARATARGPVQLSQGSEESQALVYIIMYNPSTPMEGIHTYHEQDDILLAFESIDDCVNLAQLIRDDGRYVQEYGEPIPTPLSVGQIQTACNQMGLRLAIVPPA